HGPVTVFKAWVEMLHRYIASALGLLIILLAVMAWRMRRDVTGGAAGFLGGGRAAQEAAQAPRSAPAVAHAARSAPAASAAVVSSTVGRPSFALALVTL